MNKELLFQMATNSAGIFELQGYSVKYNQMIENGNFLSGENGFQFYRLTHSVLNGVLSLVSTDTEAVVRSQNFYTISGHSYFILVNVLEKTGNWDISSFGINVAVGKNEGIYTATSPQQIHIYGGYDTIGTTLSINKYMIIDLTATFGAGNEPATVADFYKTELGKLVKAGKYLQYTGTNGGILNATAPFTFSGRNLNSGLEQGQINDYGLADVVDNNHIRTSNFIKVEPNTSYYFYKGFSTFNNSLNYYEYNENKQGIYHGTYVRQITYGTTGTITTSANAQYIKFDFYNANGIIVGNQQFLLQLSTETNTNYVPYLNKSFSPATPFTLKSATESFGSLLGKQNNLQQSNGKLYNFLTFSDGYWRYYTTPQVAWNITPLSQNRKYVLISKFNTLEHFRNDVIPISNGNAWNFNVNTEYRANNTIVSIMTNSTFTSAIICLRYNNGASLEGTIGEYCILIDLTACGLDTLTAQQFYDQYHNWFDYLANGGSITKIADTWKNTNGENKVLVGSVDLGTLNWNQRTNKRWACDLPSHHPTIYGAIGNLMCSKGTAQTPSYLEQTADLSVLSGFNYGYAGSVSGFLIYDNDYVNYTPAQVKSALSGVILNYELATPTTNHTATIRLPKYTTKVIDANGKEVAFK